MKLGAPKGASIRLPNGSVFLGVLALKIVSRPVLTDWLSFKQGFFSHIAGAFVETWL